MDKLRAGGGTPTRATSFLMPEEKIDERELAWNILQGETPEEVEKRCLAVLGSGLCRDIAELRGEISRAIWRIGVEPTYIVHGDYVVKVVRDLDGYIHISKTPLQEAIKDYWPFCSRRNCIITHDTEYWVCCGEVRKIHFSDTTSFREVLSWLKQEFERRADSAVYRAAIEAIEEKLEEVAEYESQQFKSAVEHQIEQVARGVRHWAIYYANKGHMDVFLKNLGDVANVLAIAGVSVEGVAKAVPSVRPRVIVARRETLESIFGRERIEDSAQRCLDAFGSAACGHLAAARMDILKALEAQESNAEIHYVVSGEFAFEVRNLPGGWAIIEVDDLLKVIEMYELPSIPLGELYVVWYWYLPHKTVKADTLNSYVESLVELRRWLTEGPADLRMPPPEVRRAALDKLNELFEYANEWLNKLTKRNPKASA